MSRSRSPGREGAFFGARTSVRRTARRGSPAVLLAALTLSWLFARSDAAPDVEPASALLVPSVFNSQVRPLLNEFCLKCHSTEKHKGDLDLERFTSLSEAMRQ